MNLPIDLGFLELSAAAVADLIFFLVVGLVAVISAILFFHWRRFGLSKKVIALVEVAYLLVVVVLVATAFFSIN